MEEARDRWPHDLWRLYGVYRSRAGRSTRGLELVTLGDSRNFSFIILTITL